MYNLKMVHLIYTVASNIANIGWKHGKTKHAFNTIVRSLKHLFTVLPGLG